jgi:hypothetical protein
MLLTVLYKTVAKKVEIFIERLATVATLQNWKKTKVMVGLYQNARAKHLINQ